MGKRIPQAFARLGLDAIAHDDLFDQATPDDQWLAAVGEQGWIVITKDDRIRFNEAERAALIAHNVGCFVLAKRNASSWQMAQNLMRVWDTIAQLAESAPKPFLYAVHADGTVRERDLSVTPPAP